MVRKLASVRGLFRTVAIAVCLLFNVAVIFSSKYFRFLFVQLSLLAIGMKIGEAHRTVLNFVLLYKLMFGAPLLMAQRASVRQ